MAGQAFLKALFFAPLPRFLNVFLGIHVLIVTVLALAEYEYIEVANAELTYIRAAAALTTLTIVLYVAWIALKAFRERRARKAQ